MNLISVSPESNPIITGNCYLKQSYPWTIFQNSKRKNGRFNHMILQRLEIQDTSSLRNTNKIISKFARKYLRLWKTKWTEYVLKKFETTKFIQKIQVAPRQTPICHIKSDHLRHFLAIFLRLRIH